MLRAGGHPTRPLLARARRAPARRGQRRAARVADPGRARGHRAGRRLDRGRRADQHEGADLGRPGARGPRAAGADVAARALPGARPGRRAALGADRLPDERRSAGRRDVTRRVRELHLRRRLAGRRRPGRPLARVRRRAAARGRVPAARRRRSASSPRAPTSPSRVGGDRTWLPADGHENFPDGEVFTAPLDDSAEGEITFTFPAVFSGRQVDDVRLRFHEGEVVEALGLARRGVPAGDGRARRRRRRVGELAFGLNDAVRVFTRNILFDEKIGGTMHLALGSAYPEVRRHEPLGAALGHDLRPPLGRRGLRGRRARLPRRAVSAPRLDTNRCSL